MLLIIIALIFLNFAMLSIIKTFGSALSVNAGIAFGIFSGAKFFAFAASLLSLILIFACIFKFQNTKYKKLRFALALIAGGAGANFIERVIYGYITDYFNIGFGPNFNIADIEIILGDMAAALFLIKNFLFYKNYLKAAS